MLIDAELGGLDLLGGGGGVDLAEGEDELLDGQVGGERRLLVHLTVVINAGPLKSKGLEPLGDFPQQLPLVPLVRVRVHQLVLQDDLLLVHQLLEHPLVRLVHHDLAHQVQLRNCLALQLLRVHGRHVRQVLDDLLPQEGVVDIIGSTGFLHLWVELRDDALLQFLQHALLCGCLLV